MSAVALDTRISRRFEAVREAGRGAFVTFLTAGDPDYATSLEIVQRLPAAGADVIELGMPFSDPMADGPAIQASSQRALKAGQTLVKTLEMVRAFREGDQETPIVLMGYYNPIYVYGVDAFLQKAIEVGVDGLIIVDLPPEEDEELCLPALEAGISFVRLATPTTDDKRLPAVLALLAVFASLLLPVLAFAWVFGALIVEQLDGFFTSLPEYWEKLVAFVKERSPGAIEFLEQAIQRGFSNRD